MTRYHLIALGIYLSFVLAAVGCGDTPTESVATVGTNTVPRAAFDRWARGNAELLGRTRPDASYDPANHQQCIRVKQRLKSNPSAAGAQEGATALGRECRQEQRERRADIMHTLLSDEWILQEAERERIDVSNAAVKAAFVKAKRELFPEKGSLEKFLRRSGVLREDMFRRARASLLKAKLERRRRMRSSAVTEDDVERYYSRHRNRFALPERRDLRVLITRTREAARRGRAALTAGRSWTAVETRYSSVPALTARDGRVRVADQGQPTDRLGTAVFSAPVGVIRGPVKAPAGWHVFLVEAVRAAAPRAFNQVRTDVKKTLIATRLAHADAAFISRYRRRTTCAPGYRVPPCGNARRPAER